MRFREWFQMMTLGHPGKYLRLMAWCLFDSIVMSVPYGLMLGAVYFLLAPLAKSEAALPTGALWGLAAGFLAQLIVYFFIRQKTYIDACTGYAGIIKDSRITLGEHLRQLSMGFYSSRDAGDLSTVLLRDYQTVGDLSQQLLPQVAVIVIRFVLAAVCLSWFNGWMTLALFAVIPLALPLRSGACGGWGRSAPISSGPSVKCPPASWNMSMAFKPSGPSIWPASTFKASRSPLTRSGRQLSAWRPARPRR